VTGNWRGLLGQRGPATSGDGLTAGEGVRGACPVSPCVKLPSPFPGSKMGQGKRETKSSLQAAEYPVSSFCGLFAVSASALLLGKEFFTAGSA